MAYFKIYIDNIENFTHFINQCSSELWNSVREDIQKEIVHKSWKIFKKSSIGCSLLLDLKKKYLPNFLSCNVDVKYSPKGFIALQLEEKLLNLFEENKASLREIMYKGFMDLKWYTAQREEILVQALDKKRLHRLITIKDIIEDEVALIKKERSTNG